MFGFNDNDLILFFTIFGSLIAFLALIYAIFYNFSNDKKKLKKERKEFLKKLSSSVKKIKFNDLNTIKEEKLDDFRDEINFCELFDDQEKNYMKFSEKIDDDFYLLANEFCEQNFKVLKNNLLSTIRSFKY